MLDDEDPIAALVCELGTSDRPSAAWLAASSREGDPLATAWQASGLPYWMVRLLAIANHPDVDAAARAAIEAAAETLRREHPESPALAELAARASSVDACGELSQLLHVVWCGALPDVDRRPLLEREIAARVRAVVQRPPTIADLEPPARPTRSISTGATELADRVADRGRLRALAAEDVRSGSQGRVLSPEAFGRIGQELGGLACERIFGGWRPRSSDLTQDDRATRWGHIELARPCVHPVVPGARLACLPVVPPHFRRARVVEVEALREHARRRRAHLESCEDLCDDVEQILAEQGLTDPDALTEPGLFEHPLDTVYRAFINVDRRQRRLIELDAPIAIIEQQSEQLDRWSRALLHTWRTWLDELPADTQPAWALRALAAHEQ